MNSADYSRLYDEDYFRHGCGLPYQRSAHWLEFFGKVAAGIVQEIGPRTVLDAGCAMGFLVEGLRERGVEAFGVDVSEYALRHVRADLKPYCWLASLADPLPGRYDLVVCIEVLEHIPAPEGERALDNLCAVADDILFSSSPSDFEEATHFNVQPAEYWAERFARRGFMRDLAFDAGFLNSWAVRFRRTNDPWHRVVGRYERRLTQMTQESRELRRLAVESRDQLAEQAQTILALQARQVESEQVMQLLQIQTVEEARTALAQITTARAEAAQFAELRRTFAWRVVEFLRWVRRAIAPPASRRHHWLSRILRAQPAPPAPEAAPGEADL